MAADPPREAEISLVDEDSFWEDIKTDSKETSVYCAIDGKAYHTSGGRIQLAWRPATRLQFEASHDPTSLHQIAYLKDGKTKDGRIAFEFLSSLDTDAIPGRPVMYYLEYSPVRNILMWFTKEILRPRQIVPTGVIRSVGAASDLWKLFWMIYYADHNEVFGNGRPLSNIAPEKFDNTTKRYGMGTFPFVSDYMFMRWMKWQRLEAGKHPNKVSTSMKLANLAFVNERYTEVYKNIHPNEIPPEVKSIQLSDVTRLNTIPKYMVQLAISGSKFHQEAYKFVKHELEAAATAGVSPKEALAKLGTFTDVVTPKKKKNKKKKSSTKRKHERKGDGDDDDEGDRNNIIKRLMLQTTK